jgi:hypothetical protein
MAEVGPTRASVELRATLARGAPRRRGPPAGKAAAEAVRPDLEIRERDGRARRLRP